MFIFINTSEVPILLETLTKIVCTRINRHSRTIEDCTFLTLTQFQKICKNIQNHLDVMVDMTKKNLLSQRLSCGTLDHQKETSLDRSLVTDKSCSICYENMRNRVLPCCHSFCNECIDHWITYKVQCPICRNHIESVTDEWVVTDLPNLTDVMLDLRELFEAITNENKSH